MAAIQYNRTVFAVFLSDKIVVFSSDTEGVLASELFHADILARKSFSISTSIASHSNWCIFTVSARSGLLRISSSNAIISVGLSSFFKYNSILSNNSFSFILANFQLEFKHLKNFYNRGFLRHKL